jgi:hypothetical protein
MGQWRSACVVCSRPWVQSPALKKEKKMAKDVAIQNEDGGIKGM